MAGAPSTRMWITIPIWMISIKICPNGLSPCRCIFWEVDLDRSKKLGESGKNIIQDRTIYEDAHIFAENLNEMNLLSDRDYSNYTSLFNLMKSFVSAPDLLIYLKADISTLTKQIAKRGREYEAGISIDYLMRLNKKYEAWINSYKEGKLLIIDVNDLDFVEREEDFGYILERIDAELNGLF